MFEDFPFILDAIVVWATKFKQSPKNVNVAGSVVETKKNDAVDQNINMKGRLKSSM